MALQNNVDLKALGGLVEDKKELLNKSTDEINRNLEGGVKKEPPHNNNNNAKQQNIKTVNRNFNNNNSNSATGHNNNSNKQNQNKQQQQQHQNKHKFINPNISQQHQQQQHNKNDTKKQNYNNKKYQNQGGSSSNAGATIGSGGSYNNNYNNNYGNDDYLDEKRPDRKFTGRCRLFVGNLPSDISESEFKELFLKFGEVGEVFLNSARSFGFIKLDTRINAEHAKQELDGTLFKGRNIRIRFASHGAAVRVKNLSPYISNEYLEQAFSMFGRIERAIVIVDDKGRSTGEGIVEFERKPAAAQCIQKCTETCFLLTSYPKPVIVEPLEQKDDEDGLTEKSIIKNPQYYQERDCAPRFALPDSFEFTLASKWKELYEQEKQFNEEVKKRVEQAKEMLEYEVEQAIMDQKTALLKEDLRRRQEELLRMEELRKTEVQRRQEIELEWKRRQHDFRQDDMFVQQQQNDNRQNNRKFNQGGLQQNNDVLIMNQQQQQASMLQQGGAAFGGVNNNRNNRYDQQQQRQIINQQYHSQDVQQLAAGNGAGNVSHMFAAAAVAAVAAAAQNGNNNSNYNDNRKNQRANVGRDDSSYPGYDRKRPRY